MTVVSSEREPRVAFPPSMAGAALLFLFLLLELGAAYLAWHTVGEIVSALYFMLIMLLTAAALLLMFVHRKSAIGLLLLLALVVIPYQGWLGIRWFRIHQESERIITYVQEYREVEGEYPPDLDGYRFRDAGIAPYLQRYEQVEESGGFQLAYFIGTRTTSHFYSPQGGWSYYPD